MTIARLITSQPQPHTIHATTPPPYGTAETTNGARHRVG